MDSNDLSSHAPPRSRPSDRSAPQIPPGVEYHRVLSGGKLRIGRGVLAIVLLVAGMFVFNIAIAVATGFIDMRTGRTPPTLGGTDYTPLFHASNLFSIALLIPWSMLIQRWLYDVPGSSLHSVVSRFRFDVFGRAFLIIGPVWLLLSLIGVNFLPVERAHFSSAYLISVFALTLLLTPLQSAGEEYGFRGLVFRVAGSWGRGPRTALVIGVLVSSLVFTSVHLSLDLHDVFGRTLATIAVKSSLASELVRRGHDERAAVEITGVRRLAEEAGTEVRLVVRGELRTTWDVEVAEARSLLESAGIRCTVTGDPVPEECAEALGWVVREGVTNLLRHSAATRVTLATANEEGEVLLTIANDGAGPATEDTGDGTGLRAMSERIGALGGRLTTRRDGDWFLLDAMTPLPKGKPA